MEKKKETKSAELKFDDFLLLDRRLLPLLGDYEKSGDHLRLLSVMTHSATTTGPKHQIVYRASQKQAFLFLQNHKDDPFDVTFILGLHKALTNGQGGTWKSRNTYFERDDGSFYITTSAEKTPEVMRELCAKYAFLNTPKAADFDEIFKFVLHFICIHPFLDGNGRMSALLMETLLYKVGLCAAIYLPIDPLMNGLYEKRTCLEIRKASGSFYGMKELSFDSYLPYVKEIVHKSYLYLIESLEQ